MQPYRGVLASLIVLTGAVLFAVPVHAVPPASPYLPGEAIDPGCAPGDTNCTVVAPPAGTGAAGRVVFWNATATVTSTQLFFWDDASDFLGIGTNNPSTTLHVVGTATLQGFTFTNATGSGNLQIGTVSSTGITFTNATGSGNLRLGTVSSTGLTFTNATGSGNLQAATFIATSFTSSTGLTFTNATGSGNFRIGTVSSTGITFTNATGSGNLQSNTVSSTGLTFTNATGSGNLQAATINITGLATLASSTVLSASPLASASAALLRLGPTTIQGGNASGTFIGVNPASFTGDFLNFQVNSSTKFQVTSGGFVAIATSSQFSATTTLTVCARNNCVAPSSTTSTNAVAYFASTDGTTAGVSIIARGTITSGQADVGEYVDVVGDPGEYHAGDVLSVAPSAPGKFEKSGVAYDTKLAGIVTETAGLIAGGGADGHGSVVIALAGRVPVKVTGENGPIAIGDYLTSSHKQGFAMKATQSGKVFAIALESFSGGTDEQGKVLAFVNVTWRFVGDGTLQGGNVSAASLNSSGFDPRFNYSFDNLTAKKFTIGSADAPAGFTMFDKTTKQPSCIELENGTLKITSGACSGGEITPQPAASAPALPTTEPQNGTEGSSSAVTPGSEEAPPLDAPPTPDEPAPSEPSADQVPPVE